MRRMRFVNVEAVNERMESGQSVGLYLGHFGNWEWISSFGLWLKPGMNKAQIFHKLQNKTMNRLMTELRERMGGNDIFEVMIRLNLFYMAVLVLGLNIWTTNDNALLYQACNIFLIF